MLRENWNKNFFLFRTLEKAEEKRKEASTDRPTDVAQRNKENKHKNLLHTNFVVSTKYSFESSSIFSSSFNEKIVVQFLI